MKDIIYIEDLRVKTIIGIFDWERETKQEVSIDIEFPFDCKKAAKNDSIEDTLDYKKICKAVKLRISKPGALRGAKDVGIKIER